MSADFKVKLRKTRAWLFVMFEMHGGTKRTISTGTVPINGPPREGLVLLRFHNLCVARFRAARTFPGIPCSAHQPLHAVLRSRKPPTRNIFTDQPLPADMRSFLTATTSINTGFANHYVHRSQRRSRCGGARCARDHLFVSSFFLLARYKIRAG